MSPSCTVQLLRMSSLLVFSLQWRLKLILYDLFCRHALLFGRCVHPDSGGKQKKRRVQALHDAVCQDSLLRTLPPPSPERCSHCCFSQSLSWIACIGLGWPFPHKRRGQAIGCQAHLLLFVAEVEGSHCTSQDQHEQREPHPGACAAVAFQTCMSDLYVFLAKGRTSSQTRRK